MAIVLFDFDGTIADSLQLVVDIYRDLLHDDRELTPQELDMLRKLSAQRVAKELGVSLWRAPLLLRRGRKIMHSRITEVEPFADMPETIAALHARGHVLQVVSSNSVENVRDFLERNNMAEYFQEIHGSVGLFSKARSLRRIVRVHKFDPAQTFYIGDEARDVVAAKKARIRVIAVSWGYNHRELLESLAPDTIADKPDDLLELIPDTTL